MRHQWPWLTATLLIAVGIFALSSRPAPSIGASTLDGVASYLAHFLIYASLAVCLLKATVPSSFRGSALVALAVLLYGISDELHQATVATRDASVADAGVDLLGALAGVLLPRAPRLKRKEKWLW